MQYIWMIMLILIDLIWFILSFVDLVSTIKFIKENTFYTNVIKFIKLVMAELEEYTTGFFCFNVFVLFCMSLGVWLNS